MAPYMNCFTLLQTMSLVYVLVTFAYTGSSLSHDEECSALFQFKQSMVHHVDVTCAARGFQAFNSWKLTSNASDAGFDCCSWYGVECSRIQESDQVVGLDLSESSLCGHINSSSTLFSLIYLQSLNLAMNNFHGSQIPFEISHLKQLRSLNLSESGFSGQIPNEISQLMHLSSLDLSYNPLKLQSPSGLKNLVQNLTGLEELHLSGVEISSYVPHFLANFSSLRSIKLRNCSLLNDFPPAILQLPKLKILNLASNPNLTGSFPEFLNSSNHLIVLALSGCSFSGRIPRSLSNLTQLTYLGLGSNNFTGYIPSLVSLSKLNVLELGGNKFEKGRLPNWFGKLTELNKLYLYDMNINGEIPPFLANLTKLSVINMEMNSLIGHIPPSYFNLTQLTYVALQNNQLEGPISSSNSNFKNLEYLNLAFNSFSGKVDIGTFLGLNKLQTLALGNNRISLEVTNNFTNTSLPELEYLHLSSCNLKEFPAFLRFQNKMKLLVIDRNIIDGLIPVWIWNNSQETLQVIDLSYNSITGFHQYPVFLPWRCLKEFHISNNHLQGQLPIPPQTTVVFDVSYNNLTGEIPPLICKVKSLQVLYLSSNNMGGTLPACLGSLSNSLTILNLRRNNFHGMIMNTFMDGCRLTSIILSKNRFGGQLPRSLTNCTNLKVLSLEDNSFDDVFPSWLGTLANLQALVLRSNKFYGPIEGSTTVWSQFPKLILIDLSDNRFSGQLHQEYFQTWNLMHITYSEELNPSNAMIFEYKGKGYDLFVYTLLTVVDLSCNHFQGEIPQSLQDLRGIVALNLSNNRFTGRVLPALGYLEILESLDLSRNKLTGEIPQELLRLNSLAILDVSFNNLDGRIPTGNQFITFDNSSYEGNPGLCGQPLSKECQDSKESTFPPTSNSPESLLPSDITDWVFIFSGVGSGLVVGVVIGNFLYSRYNYRFRKTKNRWVRPLRNTSKNKAGNLQL